MSTAILWLRRDLRLNDNPALQAALADCQRLIPVYIHSPQDKNEWPAGAASRWWLHHSLAALAQQLRQRGSQLFIRSGTPLAVLRELSLACSATHIYWNRIYEPAVMARDKQLKQALQQNDLHVTEHNGALLSEPWQVLKADGTPYKVFTAYYNAVRRHGLDLTLASAPAILPSPPAALASTSLESLQLLPRIAWDAGLHAAWQPGEVGAQQQLHHFIEQSLQGYLQERERPDHGGTSRLSPYLHFGELSPRRLVALVEQAANTARDAGLVQQAEGYIRQVIWREFAHQLLHHYPHTTTQPLDARYNRFPWSDDYTDNLIAWQFGDTGIPIVDAGMRELWSSGWMHNRVRMVVASFLTKNLLIPWQEGARWFWDTLVDADLANNTLGWQWVAGCGADAAPYFRIFNPVSQGEKFDPDGSYVRRWLPELAHLPAKHIHQPWTASQPPAHYPPPLVDLKASRERALAAYARLKQTQPTTE